MSKLPVIFDVETKKTFRDEPEHKKLGISVAACYDFATSRCYSFTEKELPALFRFFENASYIIGYNILGFDIPVLSAYYPGDLTRFASFDIMEDVRSKIGRRLGLNDLLFATLAKKKTGHGLGAIDLYKEGKWDELKRYCQDDVMLTKELFDFGLQHNEVYYLNENGKISVRVSWQKWMLDPGKSETHLILPF